MQPRCRKRAFTLVELLVVLTVIALLVTLLLPALAGARRSARATVCLARLGQLGVAHTLYLNDHKERLIDAGLPHGGVGAFKQAWPVTLSAYIEPANPAFLRSPLDASRFWTPAEGGQFDGLTLTAYLDALRANPAAQPARPIARWTSYGLNNYLTRTHAPAREVMARDSYDRLAAVPRPHATVHFLLMTFGDTDALTSAASYARADHVDADTWGAAGAQAAPRLAARQAQINAVAGPAARAASTSNYAHLDGHASARPFSDVYTDENRNRMDPDKAP